MSDFSKRLSMLRKSKGITQQELAEYLNFGYTAISNYESGRNESSFDTLIKIAEFFDVSLEFLLGFDCGKITNKELFFMEKELWDLSDEELNSIVLMIKAFRKNHN